MTASGPDARETALAVGLLAIAVAVVFGGAVRTFFSQDDFLYLAQARGLVPRPLPWFRPLAHIGFFSTMNGLVGLNASLWHAAALALHVLTVVLFWGLVRARASAPAALLAACVAAVHPALFTAAYWIAAANVQLAWALALAALHAESMRGRARWTAVPLAALAVWARETTVVLPALVMIVRLHDRRPVRDRLMLAMSLAVAATFAVTLVSGVAARQGEVAAAYHAQLGPHVIANLVSYLGWTVNVVLPFVRAFSDALDPTVTGWAIAAAVVLAAGACVPALRRHGWLLGAEWFLLALVPVLPLANHTYHYYLYGPLFGAAWCVAAAWQAAAEAIAERAAADAARRAGAAPRHAHARVSTVTPVRLGGAALASLLAIAWIANAAALVRKIESYPFAAGLRSDPTVDRAIIASHAVRDLSRAEIPAGTTLRFWSPLSQSTAAEQGWDTRDETYFERNVRAALMDGLAVRIFLPDVRAVEFVRAFAIADSSVRYAVYRPDGSLAVGTPAELLTVMQVRGLPQTPRTP